MQHIAMNLYDGKMYNVRDSNVGVLSHAVARIMPWQRNNIKLCEIKYAWYIKYAAWLNHKSLSTKYVVLHHKNIIYNEKIVLLVVLQGVTFEAILFCKEELR